MKIKKIVSMSLAACMLFSLSGCNNATEMENVTNREKVKLVMAEVNPLETTVAGLTDLKFKEEVEKLSGGTIEIELKGFGSLGSENTVLDKMIGGSEGVDMARISVASLTAYGAKKSMLLSVPYTFSDRDHYWEFVQSDIAKEILAESESLGIKGLFYGEDGFRHFFTKKEITGLADLKNLRLGVNNDPVMTGVVTGLGASAVYAASNEVGSLLNSGMIDGAEQTLVNYKANAYMETAKNVILDGHTIGAIEMIITNEAWNKLTADQQKAIEDAAGIAKDYNKNLSISKENETIEELKKNGCNIVEVKDKTEWKKACADITNKAIKGQEDIYNKILGLKK